MSGTPLGDGAVGVIEEGGRSIVAPDGTVRHAATTAPEALMGGVRVPTRLGGGFLFWSGSVMYRARSFVGALEAIAPLPTNAIDVSFGPAALLVTDPAGGRKAYDLDRARRVALSPHGVVDAATSDDGRAVAVDAAGRALASTDGGKTWKDVTAELGGRPGRPFAESSVVGFETAKNEGVWLGTNGTMTRGGFPELHAAGSGLSEIMFALLGGAPVTATTALVGRSADVKTVDLLTGTAVSTRTVAPGRSCAVLTADEEGVAVCYEYGVKKSSVTIFSHVLGAAPRKETEFVGTPRATYASGVLVVGASCDGATSLSLACVRRPGGTWTQLDAQPAVDATAIPASAATMPMFFQPIPVTWVPREDGRATALAMKRAVKPDETFRVARFDPPAGPVVFLDKPIAALEHYKWVVGRDGTLRGFGPTSSIAIDGRGHVEEGAREFATLAPADPLHALAVDASHSYWQTTDGGAHWIEVAGPPGPADTTPPLGAQRMQCSLAGCVLPATGGSWLRTGWPEEPPSHGAATPATHVARSTVANAVPAPSEVVPTAPPASPAPALPRLRCTTSAEPRSSQVRAAQSDRQGEPWNGVFGGRRLREREGAQSFMSFAYRDEYAGAGDAAGTRDFGYGLRAVARFPGSARSEVDTTRLFDRKALVEALYVEPFDPTGAIVHATRRLAARTAPADPVAPGKRGASAPSFLDEHVEPGARPVLSSLPGHADGVLLAGGVPLWVDHAGTVHRVEVPERGCSLYGGYADQHGKLWVACESSAGGIQVIEGETGVVSFRLPDVLPFVPMLRARPSSYPQIPMHVFTDPDAIAIAPDGSMGVLRLPSGLEPSTEDDPALYLSPGAPPVELAPWSKLEMASSSACTSDHTGYRAVIQTGAPWVAVEGAPGFRFRAPGMSAIVRWSKARVCVESVEVGYEQLDDGSSPAYGLKVMAVARFVGAGIGAGLVGTGRDGVVRQPARCGIE